MSWEVAGLPLHILVIHAAVVFGPLAALSALAYVGVPRYRDLLRWPTFVLVVIAVGSIWAAYFTGQNFFDSDRFANFSGEALENIETHEDYAKTLRWIASGFGIVTVRGDLLLPRPRGHHPDRPGRAGRDQRGGHAGVGGADRRRWLPRRLELASARSGQSPPAR